MIHRKSIRHRRVAAQLADELAAMVVEPIEEAAVGALPHKVRRAGILHSPTAGRVGLVMGRLPVAATVATVGAHRPAIDATVNAVKRAVAEFHETLLLGNASTSRGRLEPMVSIRPSLKADLLWIGFGENVRRGDEGSLALCKETNAHRAHLVQRNDDLAIGSDAGPTDIPEKTNLAAIDILAVAGKLAHRNGVTLARPTQPPIVGILENIVTQRIDALIGRNAHAFLSLHLGHPVGVVVVESINSSRGNFQQHRVGSLGPVGGFKAHLLNPGLPLIVATKSYGMLSRSSLMPCARGHDAKPGAIIGDYDIRLVAIALAGNLTARLRSAIVAQIRCLVGCCAHNAQTEIGSLLERF